MFDKFKDMRNRRQMKAKSMLMSSEKIDNSDIKSMESNYSKTIVKTEDKLFKKIIEFSKTEVGSQFLRARNLPTKFNLTHRDKKEETKEEIIQ